jgi:hypothetical protein
MRTNARKIAKLDLIPAYPPAAGGKTPCKSTSFVILCLLGTIYPVQPFFI